MGENGFRSGFGFGCGCVFSVITSLLAALLALAFLGMHMKEQREKHKSQQQWKLNEKIKPGSHDFAGPNVLALPNGVVLASSCHRIDSSALHFPARRGGAVVAPQARNIAFPPKGALTSRVEAGAVVARQARNIALVHLHLTCPEGWRHVRAKPSTNQSHQPSYTLPSTFTSKTVLGKFM
jgi:hypothetical protein